MGLFWAHCSPIVRKFRHSTWEHSQALKTRNLVILSSLPSPQSPYCIMFMLMLALGGNGGTTESLSALTPTQRRAGRAASRPRRGARSLFFCSLAAECVEL